MFGNNYQTNVLMSDNQTLYINNVRLRGYIAARSTIRGVLFHLIENDNYSQLAHLLLIHAMNFKTHPHRPYIAL